MNFVAIVGAGLGGCALAIALAKERIPVTIYESRLKDTEVIHSGVVLSPNGLRVLSQLGLYERIRDRCYVSNYRTFKNDRDETVKKVISADKSIHGFCNHRIWRSILLDEMKSVLAEYCVNVQYGSKFEGIMEDNERGVTFLINGERKHAALLIGSDGIYSTVRQHIDPDVEPYYTGVTAVLAHIKRNSVAWPYEDYERNATIQGKPNAIFFIPEDPEAEVIMTGLQVQYPQQSREDLEKMQADKDQLAEFYRKGYEEHGPTARSIIDAVVANKQSSYIWPFLKMPTLKQWYSDSGRVIIMGDAAHALPPSSAQGVNQALEDAYTFTLLLSSFGALDTIETSKWLAGLASWQDRRQQRIDAIFDWATNVTNVARLPADERVRLAAEGKLKGRDGQDDMSWLYGYDAKRDFEYSSQRAA